MIYSQIGQREIEQTSIFSVNYLMKQIMTKFEFLVSDAKKNYSLIFEILLLLFLHSYLFFPGVEIMIRGYLKDSSVIKHSTCR